MGKNDGTNEELEQSAAEPNAVAEVTPEDRVTARAALQKIQAGETLTRDEKAALARVRKAEEERTRWKFYHTIPAQHYRLMSGRDARTLFDQADRHGLPLRGRDVPGVGRGIIDLPAVLKGFHDLIASNAAVMGALKREGADPTTRAKIHELDLRLKEIEVAEAEKKLVPFERVQSNVMELFGGLGRAIEAMRQAGVSAEHLQILADEMTIQERRWLAAWEGVPPTWRGLNRLKA